MKLNKTVKIFQAENEVVLKVGTEAVCLERMEIFKLISVLFKMVTTLDLVKASELVRSSSGNEKIDLFMIFVDLLDLHDDDISQFAECCGFTIATNVTIVI